MQADESETFRRAVALEPGSYTYKFVVDGEWETDKENPVQEPDGFGGTNAVLKLSRERRKAATSPSTSISWTKRKSW